MNGKPQVVGSKDDPSRGVKFFDPRGGITFLTADDDRGLEPGDTVFVGGTAKVYGPYKLGDIIGAGNGQVHFKAFKVDENGNRQASTKPLTKAELEQKLAQLIAENEKLKTKPETTKSK